MNDKKQIEEMASIIRVVLEERTDIGYIPNLAFPIAKKLLEHYQPKIPKDSVVLTREECSNLYEKGYENGKEVAERFYKPLVSAATRTETAWEILQDLYSEATSNISETLELTTFQIEQLAKRYGVDLGE